MTTNQIDSDQAFSGVAQTANIGSSTSVSSGAAKIFREFKWGLLTLFILMTVVVCLVYDGGRGKKKIDAAQVKPATGADTNLNLVDQPAPAVADNPSGSSTVMTQPTPSDHPEARPSHGDERSTVWDVDTNPQTPLRRLGSIGTGSSDAPTARSGNAGTTSRNRTAARIPALANADGTQTAADASPRPGRLVHAPGDAHETAGHGAEQGFKWYTVKAGDNLTRIANANLPGKGGNRAIQEANKDTIPDMNKLREGMKIKIPNVISTSQAADTASHGGASSIVGNHAEPVRSGENVRTNPSIIMKDDYVVQSGDTLERIARRVLNDSHKWKELLEWNKDRITDSSKLKVGMVLRTHGGNQLAPSDGMRLRQNTVRAEAEPAVTNPNDPQNQPNAEEVPIPIHPVAANSTSVSESKNEKTSAPKKSKPSKQSDSDEDAAVRALILQ